MAELTGKRVLIVDDDRDILAALSATFTDEGAEVFTAADGNEAITQADAHPPDLVLLDMMLPKRSGFLVLEKLKRGKPKNALPRVIMITGNPGTRHKVYAEAQGVDTYVNKPFKMDVIVAQAKKLFD